MTDKDEYIDYCIANDIDQEPDDSIAAGDLTAILQEHFEIGRAVGRADKLISMKIECEHVQPSSTFRRDDVDEIDCPF